MVREQATITTTITTVCVFVWQLPGSVRGRGATPDGVTAGGRPAECGGWGEQHPGSAGHGAS